MREVAAWLSEQVPHQKQIGERPERCGCGCGCCRDWCCCGYCGDSVARVAVVVVVVGAGVVLAAVVYVAGVGMLWLLCV